MDRSKSEESDDAHTMHTDSLKSTVRSSKLKGADGMHVRNAFCYKICRVINWVSIHYPPDLSGFNEEGKLYLAI